MALSLYDFLRDPNAPPSPFEEPTGPHAQASNTRPKGLRESMFQQFRSDRTATLPVAKKMLRREQHDRDRKNQREWLLEQRRGRPPPSSQDEVDDSPGRSSPARPARAAPVVRARGAQDRLAQLRAFQAERAQKRQAGQKGIRPPFRVGVYKLTQDIQQNLAPVEGAEKSTLKNVSSRIDTHRKGARPTPARHPIVSTSSSKAKKSLFNKSTPKKTQRAWRAALVQGGKNYVNSLKTGRPKADLAITSVVAPESDVIQSAPQIPIKLDLLTEKQDLSLNLIAETPEVITSSPVSEERETHPALKSAKRRRSSRLANKVRPPSPLSEAVIPEEPEDDVEAVVSFKTTHRDLQTPTEESKSFLPSTSLTPFIAAMEVSKKPDPVVPPPVCTEVSHANFQFLSPSVVGNFKFTATPKAPLDKDGFKTPNMRSLGGSIKSRRSKRMSEACGLIDPLRKDVLFQRGSSSAKRRIRKGQDPYVDLKDISFDDVPADPFSPFHKVMQSRTKTTLDPILTPLVNHGGSPQVQRVTPIPKTLAMEFEQINQEAPSNPGAKDVNYFRSLLKTETDRLAALCCHWESKLESLAADANFSEETTGQIRSVIGKAKLMSNRKGRFEQFATLIDNCEFNRGEQKTTCMDLQGFWEMIYFQVEDIDELFKELNTLEASGWMEAVVDHTAPAKNAIGKKLSNKRTNLAKNRKAKSPGKATAALKELMANKRKLMRDKTQKNGQPNLSAKDSLQPVDASRNSPEKVFDGGFFAVRSPLRKLSPNHCGPNSNRKISMSAEARTPKTSGISSMTKRVTRSSQRLSSRPTTAQTLQFNENEEPMV
ncbi:disks large-associated protein 4-like isoform X1 [Tigriopus californicus]|uniref:disks large-associated protein 4-like isoform X1 n=1 Tax=Tigriopus californicus TaxID=6832 RepID=UPI0027DA3A7F|nr:disks large-associated protein 4-like isoform X1 [Tigriopus californicus]|eukprot:TCALIF_11173-PA protein Name:"Similar to Dlgap5 Disks large-associated protein 5 (Mus musculus)" AED:0.18 eAED:0.18 QI:234/0.77/0.6/0.8/1/1/10/0/824